MRIRLYAESALGASLLLLHELEGAHIFEVFVMVLQIGCDFFGALGNESSCSIRSADDVTYAFGYGYISCS